MTRFMAIVKNLPHDIIGLMYTRDKVAVKDIAEYFDTNARNIREVLHILKIDLDRNRYSFASKTQKQLVDESKVIKMYVDDKMAPLDISKILKVPRHTIYKILKTNKIKITRKFHCKYNPVNKTLIDDKLMIELAEKHTVNEIAEMFDVKQYIIRTRLKKFNLKALSGRSNSVAAAVDARRKSQLNENAVSCLDNKDWMIEQYMILNKPSRVIAKEIKCGKKAVLAAVRRHGLPVSLGTKKGVIKSKLFGEIGFDSYLERAVIEQFEKDSMISFGKREPISIKYDHTRWYRPDFLINRNGFYLIEVKAAAFVDAAHLKTNAAEDFCKSVGWKYKIITDPTNIVWE